MSLEEIHNKNDDSLPCGRHQPQLRDSGKTVASYFSEYNYGKFVLDTIVRISIITFTSYPGENYLQVLVPNIVLDQVVYIEMIKLHLHFQTGKRAILLASLRKKFHSNDFTL